MGRLIKHPKCISKECYSVFVDFCANCKNEEASIKVLALEYLIALLKTDKSAFDHQQLQNALQQIQNDENEHVKKLVNTINDILKSDQTVHKLKEYLATYSDENEEIPYLEKGNVTPVSSFKEKLEDEKKAEKIGSPIEEKLLDFGNVNEQLDTLQNTLEETHSGANFVLQHMKERERKQRKEAENDQNFLFENVGTPNKQRPISKESGTSPPPPKIDVTDTSSPSQVVLTPHKILKRRDSETIISIKSTSPKTSPTENEIVKETPEKNPPLNISINITRPQNAIPINEMNIHFNELSPTGSTGCIDPIKKIGKELYNSTSNKTIELISDSAVESFYTNDTETNQISKKLDDKFAQTLESSLKSDSEIIEKARKEGLLQAEKEVAIMTAEFEDLEKRYAKEVREKKLLEAALSQYEKALRTMYQEKEKYRYDEKYKDLQAAHKQLLEDYKKLEERFTKLHVRYREVKQLNERYKQVHNSTSLCLFPL